MEFNEQNINSLIEHWRGKVKKAEDTRNDEDLLVARCYVDAFQTVRINHGLGLLPKEK